MPERLGRADSLLGKGGVDAPSRNIPVPLKGADGEAVKKLESSAIPLLASLLRWCKEGNNALSQLIHTFGVVRSNSKTISLERTTPVCAQLRWLRVHPSFAKDSCSCMFAEWFCIRRQTRFFDRRLLVRAARQRRRYTVVGSTICGLFLAAQW